MAGEELVAGRITEVMGLRVAGLGLWLDARGVGLSLGVPASHSRFLQPATAWRSAASRVSDDLLLRVRNGPLPKATGWRTRLCATAIWELWLDEAGRYVFVLLGGTPPTRLVVDAGFRRGEVLGDFSASNGGGAYPLQALDIRLYAHWLADKGDLILHAAGVAVDGKGYCFAGSAGVGKSTVAASLSSNSVVTVLGEDQVILRYLDGCFRVFGTPWHVNPAFSSPLGVPLDKLFLLDRTAARGAERCAPADGVARLLQTAFVPYCRPAAIPGILDRLALLAEQVPFYTLGLGLGDDVMPFIGET